jgi:RNA polymerase sigma factor (sigma-70 family)
MDEWDQIWRGLRAGDPAAYAFLVERLGRGVWAYLRRMTGRDDLADELFAKTWLKVTKRAARINSPRAIRQYVLSIARHEWLDSLDHRRRIASVEVNEYTSASNGVPAASPSALEALAKEEDLDRLRAAIDHLPAAQREVVVLRVYGELTFKQIAEMLGVPLGTVLTRMRLATHRLAEILTPWNREGAPGG